MKFHIAFQKMAVTLIINYIVKEHCSSSYHYKKIFLWHIIIYKDKHIVCYGKMRLDTVGVGLLPWINLWPACIYLGAKNKLKCITIKHSQKRCE